MSQAISLLNTAIKSGYPTSINAGNGLSFTTALTTSPKIYGNYLNFPLDGSIFNTARGYVTPNYPSISLVNTSATTDMFVNVNNQVINTLANSINLNGFNFSTTALGFPAQITLEGQTTI